MTWDHMYARIDAVASTTCVPMLNVGDCRRGLCNRGTFTRSHCDCDARFRRCLQAANTETANTLGAIFYNVVQVTCFQERSPCSAHQRFEDYFYSSNHCPAEYRQADLYVPPHADNLIAKILDHPHSYPQGRALHTPVAPLKHNARRIGVKLASVGLAAVNILREVVQRPRLLWDSLNSPVSRDLPPGRPPGLGPGPGPGYYYERPARPGSPYRYGYSNGNGNGFGNGYRNGYGNGYGYGWS